MISKNESGLYETEIDGKKYEFEKWGAEESLDILLDISSIIGGSLGSAIGSVFSGEGMNMEVNAGMLATVFENLTKNLKKEVVKPIFKKLCAEKTLCDGKKISFNHHYQDDLMHMFKVAKAGLEVQYGNFFGAIQGAVAPKRPQAVINRA